MSRTSLPAVLLGLAALSLPSAAPAQSWIHSWTLCTPWASFHSCHSVSIQTDAVLDNTNARTGTTIHISLHNLQGQGYAADNTSSSGLRIAYFIGPNLSLSNPQNSSVLGVPSGGATGTPTWVGSAGTYGSSGYASVVGWDALLGGCDSDPLFESKVYGGHTCLPGSAFTFSFTIGDIVDANQFASAYINAFGVSTFDFCFSDPSQYPDPGNPACDVRSESLTQPNVVPEPVTIALLGTGLLGIGGARLRRRKKDSSIDA